MSREEKKIGQNIRLLPSSSFLPVFTCYQFLNHFFQVLFQIALATLDANRNTLLAVQDDGEAMTVLGNYLEHVSNRDATMPTANQGLSNRTTSTGVWYGDGDG